MVYLVVPDWMHEYYIKDTYLVRDRASDFIDGGTIQ